MLKKRQKIADKKTFSIYKKGDKLTQQKLVKV